LKLLKQQKYNIPILYNFPAGHIQDNRALILGHTVTLDVQEKEERLPLNN
jgi:muramoyltetrapeptide carboxypeptidase